jgi:hypothetical protein
VSHYISEERISLDPKIIKSILNCPSPRDIIDVISFMDLAGYLRFIDGFSKIAYPITSLKNKGKKFE